MHADSPEALPPAIALEWDAALADAQILPTDACLLLLGGTASADGCHAKYWRRGEPLDADVAQEAGAAASVVAHRVALWGDHGLEGTSGLLRHELEHARQLMAHGDELLRLFQAAEDRLIDEIGGWPGSARMYQLIPMERDANAAGARFVRARFGADRIDELVLDGDPHAAVFRDLGDPGPLPTLPERMENFLSGLSDLCADFRLTEAPA